jgi:hypothetical protein
MDLARTTVSHASLMVGTIPVLLAASAVLFGGETMDPISWLALCRLHRRRGADRSGRQPRPRHSRRAFAAGDLLVVVSLMHLDGLDSAQQEVDADP